MNRDQIRTFLSELPDTPAQESLDPPDLVFLPRMHLKALSLDTSIVIGMRGAGKSFWTAVLSSGQNLLLLKQLTNNPRLNGPQVRVGYGQDDSEKWFPSERTLAQLLERGVDPFTIWQTVVLRHALEVCELSSPLPNKWSEAINWCSAHPEEANRLLTQCDQHLVEHNQPLLILFDALDRLAAGWPEIRHLLAGALRFGLQCRSRRMIRLKFFLRPDMEEDPEIWAFRDSSKLRTSRVELQWGRADLYGLLFHWLGNAPEIGEQFRHDTGFPWTRQGRTFAVPERLIRDEDPQKRLVATIAGPHMGTNPRRGHTYSWIHTHLADAVGRVSPRSFLLAFQKAAETTREKYPSHRYPLHYEAIQQGVIRAAETRVDELKEDYPWIHPLLEACRGAEVPIASAELIQRWDRATLGRVRKEARNKLPPRRFTYDAIRQSMPEALLDDLVELAVVYRTVEGDRINLPDIFRVQFGIKRRGGVRPPR